MKKTRKKYTREQKLEIIKLSYEDCQSIPALALRFNISSNTIYNWRNQFKKHQEDAFPGKQLREAQLERDILKKAIGIFSKKDVKFTNL